MANVKAAEAYVHPVNTVITQYTDAQQRLNDAKHDVQYTKRELVRIAVEMGAVDALTVNVNRLRRIAGL